MIAAFVILVLGSCTAWAADPPPAASVPTKPASNLRLNLNGASATDFARLPGVTAAHARAIVKGRPYRSKEELLTRKIVPESVYEDIKSNVYAGHSGR
jgi:DNA uptake protein ComE-like DNA-binding protein